MAKIIKSKVIKARKTITNETGVDSVDGIYQKHDPRTAINLVLSNLYAKRCSDDIVRTAFGRGYSGNLPEGFSDAIDRCSKEFVRCGNGYLELVLYDGVVKEVYHVSATTMRIKKVVDGVKIFYQTTKEGFFYRELNREAIERSKDIGRVSLIVHFTNYEDDPYYGTPQWIASKEKLKQTSYADEFISSFYENDAIPAGALLTKGAELDSDGEDALGDVLNRSNRGARNRRNLLHIHMDEDSDMQYITFNDNIVDAPFLALNRDNKVDICAAFHVPPKRVGLETVGRLGDSSDYEKQLNGYYEDVIVPLQEKFEGQLKLIFPDLRFNRPNIKSIEKSQLIKALKDFREDLLDAE